MENIKHKSPTQEPQPESAVPQSQKLVSVKMPPGFDTNIYIRLIPSKSGKGMPLEKKCMPRGTGESEPLLTLPPFIRERWSEINKKLMEWMKTSPQNAETFIHHPLEAFERAGIKLDRSDQKHLMRNLEEIKSITMIPPGVRIRQITTGTAKGKGGPVEKEPTPDKPNQDKKDCHCND
jgi:hypothetical protein